MITSFPIFEVLSKLMHVAFHYLQEWLNDSAVRTRDLMNHGTSLHAIFSLHFSGPVL